MLTWQNNLPRFVAKGSAGDRMILHFGRTNIDDIEISEFHFAMLLSEHQGRWSLETQWHRYGDCTRKPRVSAFLSKLNLAISMHKDFDFREYWHRWGHKDEYFTAVIINTIEEQKSTEASNLTTKLVTSLTENVPKDSYNSGLTAQSAFGTLLTNLFESR